MKAIVLFLDSRGMGGIETHVLNLAKALTDESLPVKVVFWKKYSEQVHPLWGDLEKACIPVYCAEGKVSRLFKLIPEGALVHSHGYKGNLINKVFSLPGKWTSLPTHHNGDIGVGRLKYYVQADELTSRWFSPLSVSAEIYSRLSKKGLLIPNFVGNLPALEYDKVNRSSLGNHVAFVGRMSTEKGPETFCKLANRLKNSVAPEHQAEFHLYGDGDLLPGLKQSYKTPIFHGQMNMENCWSQIDLLCITSEYEGLPLAALEAMSRGIPVCSYAIGDLPALIQHGQNGWVVPAGDLDAMASCIDNWLRMPYSKRLAMSESADQTIRSRYSAQAVVPRIIDHYMALTAS